MSPRAPDEGDYDWLDPDPNPELEMGWPTALLWLALLAVLIPCERLADLFRKPRR